MHGERGWLSVVCLIITVGVSKRLHLMRDIARCPSGRGDILGEASQPTNGECCETGLRVLARIIARQHAARAAKTGKGDVDLEEGGKDIAPGGTPATGGRN